LWDQGGVNMKSGEGRENRLATRAARTDRRKVESGADRPNRERGGGGVTGVGVDASRQGELPIT